MKKRLLALIMAAVMAVGMAGCGSSGAGENTGTGGNSSAAEQDSGTDEADAQDVDQDSGYYPVTVEVYNASKELVPYTFEKCPERTSDIL